MRGFSLDRLGTAETISPTGFPIGGNGVVILNGEVRMALVGGFGGALFLDGGNVFPRASAIDLSALRGAAGFGIRYRSPVGPIRVDLGFNAIFVGRGRVRSGSQKGPCVHLGEAANASCELGGLLASDSALDSIVLETSPLQPLPPMPEPGTTAMTGIG